MKYYVRAIEQTKAYIDSHNISDSEAFIDALRIMHCHAVECGDKRANSTVRWREHGENAPKIGNYIIFS